MLTEPDGQAGTDCQGKQEGEPLPVVAGAVNNSLDYIRSNHGRCTIGQSE